MWRQIHFQKQPLNTIPEILFSSAGNSVSMVWAEQLFLENKSCVLRMEALKRFVSRGVVWWPVQWAFGRNLPFQVSLIGNHYKSSQSASGKIYFPLRVSNKLNCWIWEDPWTRHQSHENSIDAIFHKFGHLYCWNCVNKTAAMEAKVMVQKLGYIAFDFDLWLFYVSRHEHFNTAQTL